jgi:hypothetical protein
MSLGSLWKSVGRDWKRITRALSKGKRGPGRSSEKKQETKAEWCNWLESFAKIHTTKSSRIEKRRAQAVVGNFRLFCRRKNAQLFWKKSMFPLDKLRKQLMMWPKVVRSGWW